MLNLTTSQELHAIVNSPAGMQMPVIEFPVELTPGQPKYYLSCVLAGSAKVGNGYIWNLVRKRENNASQSDDVFRAEVTEDTEYHLIAKDWA